MIASRQFAASVLGALLGVAALGAVLTSGQAVAGAVLGAGLGSGDATVLTTDCPGDTHWNVEQEVCEDDTHW